MSEEGVRHATRGRAIALGASVLIAVAAGVVAADGTVPGWESEVFHTINELPDLLRRPMWLLQLAGLLLVPGIVAFGALLLRRWWLAACLIAFIPIKLFVEKAIVKQLVERQRPYLTVCNGKGSCAHFRDAPTSGLSFVSGHAIIAWGVAGLLWPYLPKGWRWAPVILAVLNSIARVYLGAHNPLDVVGGGGIGFGVAMAMTMAVGAPRNTPAATRDRVSCTTTP